MDMHYADIWPKNAAKAGQPLQSNGIFIQQVPEYNGAISEREEVKSGALHRELPMPDYLTSGGLATWAQG